MNPAAPKGKPMNIGSVTAKSTSRNSRVQFTAAELQQSLGWFLRNRPRKLRSCEARYERFCRSLLERIEVECSRLDRETEFHVVRGATERISRIGLPAKFTSRIAPDLPGHVGSGLAERRAGEQILARK